VLYRDNLNGGAWLKWKDVPPPVSTGPIELSDPLPAGVGARFFQLVTPMSAP